MSEYSPENHIKLTHYLHRESVQQLERLSEVTGRTRSEVITDALDSYTYFINAILDGEVVLIEGPEKGTRQIFTTVTEQISEANKFESDQP